MTQKYLQTAAPIFGLICVKKEEDWLALYCGGGGSSKTGVGNQIAVVRIGENSIVPETSLDTGPELGAAMALLGTDGLIVCFGRKFRGLTLGSERDLRPRFDDVQGDFHETDPCLNSCAVDGQMLATAGDDTKLRLWRFAEEACLEKPELYKVCHGHEAAITDTRFASSGHIVCTASKDGSCRIWSAALGTCLALCDAKAATPPSILNAKPPTKKRRPPPPFKLLCRAARFSDDDTCLIALASGSRGAAFAVKWKLVQAEKDTLSPEINHVHILSENPISAVATSGKTLALGCVTGEVRFADQHDLFPLRQRKVSAKQDHDLPVTACSFAGDSLVVTASADYKIIAHQVPTDRAPTSSFSFLKLLALLCFIVAAVSAFLVFDLTTHKIQLPGLKSHFFESITLSHEDNRQHEEPPVYNKDASSQEVEMFPDEDPSVLLPGQETSERSIDTDSPPMDDEAVARTSPDEDLEADAAFPIEELESTDTNDKDEAIFSDSSSPEENNEFSSSAPPVVEKEATTQVPEEEEVVLPHDEF